MPSPAERLWDWTLRTYERPGVPEACLRLQDSYLINTSYLLWVAWADPGETALRTGLAMSVTWDQILWPLRNARRDLKAPQPGVDDEARLALREDVKAAELRAERLLMESLERLTGPAAAPIDLTAALTRAAEAWRNQPAPTEDVAALVAALA